MARRDLTSSRRQADWSHAGARGLEGSRSGHDDDPTEGFAALGVLVSRGRFGEWEPSINLHVELATCDLFQHIADHWLDARVLGQDGTAQEDAAQGVVAR